MFKIYQKYLIKKFLKKFTIISSIFLFLIFILNVLEEINFFKDLNENFFLPYFLTLLNVPITLFEIFPFIFIISTQFFVYDIFNKEEQNLLKKNGISNFKIVKILLLISIMIGVFNVAIFYNFAAKLKFHYSDIKNNFSNDNKYLAMVTDNGIWIKDEINGKKYIVKSKFIEENFLIKNIISEFNSEFKLIRSIQSEKINIKSKNWIIFSPSVTIDNVTKKLQKNIELSSNFNSNVINKLFSNISSFGILKLYNLKKDYNEFGYSTEEIVIHMLKLFSTPFFYGVFTIFALTIMYNFNKEKKFLFHLITGVLLSVSIYYINFIFLSLGQNGKIPIYPSVFFPLIIIFIISIIGLININEK